MSDLYDKIVGNRGSFERLIARIPGFRGYQDKQARRKADTMLREHIAREIDQRIGRMGRIEKLILDNMGMAYTTRTRGVKAKLQLYHDKMAAAAPGYDGMWAQIKLESEDLERIYSFDESQMLYLDQIDVGLDKLEQAALKEEALEDVIYELDGTISEAIEAFSLREDEITNLGKKSI